MYALKTPSFLRPASRPNSPSPAPVPRSDAAGAIDRAPRPLSKLSFSNFKRTASPLARAQTALVQDGSYMEVLSLKLSEAVSKALAQPSGPGTPNELLGGRRPVPAGRGRALGEFIAIEINSARENPHLYRAVIRTLHRPLSVLVTNLSGTLLPLIASPAFLSPAVPTPQYPNPNATQLHALSLAVFAGELLETFDKLGLGMDGDMRSDGLKGTRDSLVSIIQRVVDPLVSGIKNDLMPHIEALELVPLSVANKAPTGAAKVPAVHPSIAYMHTTMPIYARALGRYVTSRTAETILASLLISLIWRGLVALSNRPIPPPGPTPPSSPPLGPLSKNMKDTRRRGSSVTPPTTPPASRFALKLPPSRPPSPPGSNIKAPSVAADARALYDLLNMLPRPTDELAREAVGDAFDSLSGIVSLLDFVYSRRALTMSAAELERELDMLTVDVSTLSALPVLLKTLVFPYTAPSIERTVADMLGLTEAAYRSGCLSGFGRAEECAQAVGQRVLGVLRSEMAGAMDSLPEVVMKWLDKEIKEAASEQQH